MALFGDKKNRPQCHQNDNDMKKLVIIIISLLCVNAAFAQKDNKSVTRLENGGIKFHIEDKDAPTQPLIRIYEQECWEKILKECGINASYYNIKTHSDEDKELVCFDRNACFEGILTAFDKHYSLVLSPDIIWLLISQGIATQINENAEKLRDRLVDFEDRKTLKIEYIGSDLLEHEEHWDWIIPTFSDLIDKNMKSQFSDLMVCDFSTTGTLERVTSQITMMESVKKFFKYEVHLIGCGIPDITLLGTPDDWKEIRSRISRLDDFDLGWWRKELEPVIDEFVNASEGNLNRKFWLDMVDQYSPEKRTQAFCGSSGIIPAQYNGWFTVFFPFCETDTHISGSRIERTPKIVTHNTKVCPEIKKVDVLYVIHFLDHEETHNLELWAGFIGMEMDWKTKTLKPAISWMMREKSEKDAALDLLEQEDLELLRYLGDFRMYNSSTGTVSTVTKSYNGENTLVANRFPDVSMSENYWDFPKDCKCYTLISLRDIKVPKDLGKWCRKHKIEEVTIKARMTDDQKAEILRQVPTATVIQL